MNVPHTSARYAVFELSFSGSTAQPPGERPPLLAHFRHEAGHTVTVPGFWDGERDYRIRFCPELSGGWSWETESIDPLLDGQHGEVLVGGPEGNGPVRVAHTHHFAHADGTPHRPVGTTVYNWLHQEETLRAETVDAIHTAGFTKLRFLVFPQAGGYVNGVPEELPFERDDDGHLDVRRPSLSFFRRLDGAVDLLAAHGIQAEVLVFTSYDYGRFGFDQLTEDEDAIYLRYLVARLSAFPNVWWSLCNEYDLLPRSEERWHDAGELLAATDPHRRLRSIHNWMELPNHTANWITHASIQNGSAAQEAGRAQLYRDAYRKPVVLDEIKYEGDIPERWGDLSGRELVHRCWIAASSGCYASHGESFVRPGGSLHMVEGGAFQGESPPRLGFLRRVLDGLQIPGLDPIDPADDPQYVVGVPREQYLVYLGRSAPASWTFRLPQGNRGERLEAGDAFAIEVIDTWRMTITREPEPVILDRVLRNDAYADAAAPVALPEGAAIALRLTRIR